VASVFEQLCRVLLAEPAPTLAVAQDTTSATVSSIAVTLERKMRESAYDVYVCYHEADEAEVFQIGEALKARDILPWFDFLAPLAG